MDCSRGGIAKESTHTVVTLRAASDWWPDVVDSDLPITVQQYTTSDGRIRIVIYSNGLRVYTRG